MEVFLGSPVFVRSRLCNQLSYTVSSRSNTPTCLARPTSVRRSPPTGGRFGGGDVLGLGLGRRRCGTAPSRARSRSSRPLGDRRPERAVLGRPSRRSLGPGQPQTAVRTVGTMSMGVGGTWRGSSAWGLYVGWASGRRGRRRTRACRPPSSCPGRECLACSTNQPEGEWLYDSGARRARRRGQDLDHKLQQWLKELIPVEGAVRPGSSRTRRRRPGATMISVSSSSLDPLRGTA